MSCARRRIQRHTSDPLLEVVLRPRQVRLGVTGGDVLACRHVHLEDDVLELDRYHVRLGTYVLPLPSCGTLDPLAQRQQALSDVLIDLRKAV